MFYQFQHFGTSDYAKKEYGEDFNFPAHLHQSFEFITVTSGQMSVTVEKTSYILKKGESLLIFPNQIHSITSSRSTHMLCIFSAELVKAFTSKTSGKVPTTNIFYPHKYLIDALDKLPQNSGLIEKKGIFYSLCAEFDKIAEYKDKKDDNKNILHKIFKFVELNYKKDCSLNNLAQYTDFSYSYLSRYFKKIVGISFNEYVNQYRTSKACYLLSNTDLSILECALESGYDSLRTFNRNFYELIALTPTEYRKNTKS